MSLSSKKQPTPIIEISVLCKAWQEDGVWNAVAEDLPVAVFGNTFEQARDNLHDAILSHLESAQEMGTLQLVADELLRRASEWSFTMAEMPPDHVMMKMRAAVHDHMVVALT
ncbi:MAG: type II toxin-antitoxin system HicB family antitoxin [Terriglobales bacterium]